MGLQLDRMARYAINRREQVYSDMRQMRRKGYLFPLRVTVKVRS